MEVNKAIRERRSIRKLKSDAVDDDLIKAILEAGRWAPSWANTQCWRFVAIRDTQVKERVADTISEGNPGVMAMKQCPVAIVICAELEKSGYKQGVVRTDKGDWYMFDTALAAQNMMLAAHSLGLGTLAIGLFDANKVAKIIGVPPNMRVVLLLPLGYPDETPTAPRRKELSEIAFYEKMQ